ncbi:MAG: 30S ribosomal protein S6 [Nitrospirota bacterium]
MNVYENIVIINAALADEEADVAITKIKDFIASNGGEILKVDIWGRRKLACDINKQKKGLYVLLLYKIPSGSIKKLEEFYKILDYIVKYMIIKLNAKQISDIEKVESMPEIAEQKSKG